MKHILDKIYLCKSSINKKPLWVIKYWNDVTNKIKEIRVYEEE